jgi:hypothetical protein
MALAQRSNVRFESKGKSRLLSKKLQKSLHAKAKAEAEYRCRQLAAADHELCDDQYAGAGGPAVTASCALALVSQRTGVINQIRGFLIERGITVRQGVVLLR